jgi:predicted membrane protein
VRGIALGAALVLAIAVPVAIIGSLVLDDGSNVVFPFAGAVIGAFVAGGWFAGRHSDDVSKPTVGAAAALIGFVVAQVVAVAMQLAQDEEVRPGVIAANAVLAAACGMAGGALAAR